MNKNDILMTLLLIIVALIYFGFIHQPYGYNRHEGNRTWRSYPVISYSLEDGWHKTGTFSKSNDDIWIMKVSTGD